jgi:16S rRNA (uracil1498-N3)-methyltransferase
MLPNNNDNYEAWVMRGHAFYLHGNLFDSEESYIRALRLKTQHWQNICHSACEQSGLNMPPTVHKICSFEQWIGAQKSLHIIANPVSTSTFNSITTTPESLAITIGPEGGFSAQELTLIANSNVTEISMGHRILRADTASIAIVSLCQQKWGDL